MTVVNLIRSILLLAISLTIVACTTPAHIEIQRVSKDMDKDDVLEIMGSPQRTQRVRGQDEWVYIYPVKRNLQSKKVVFNSGYVVDIKDQSLKPSQQEIAMDSKTIKEYEERVEKDKKKTFVDLDE